MIAVRRYSVHCKSYVNLPKVVNMAKIPSSFGDALLRNQGKLYCDGGKLYCNGSNLYPQRGRITPKRVHSMIIGDSISILHDKMVTERE